MGNYINTGNDLLRQDRASRIFIDKSLMIQYTNEVLNTNAKYLCVSRPRRFGKSMAANMLAAYYDESCDSRELFHGLKIEKDPSFEKHLNKYLVIKIDLAWFITTLKDKKDIIGKLEKSILMELRLSYDDILHEDDQVLSLHCESL